MLNELYSLSDTLSNMGIATKKWHREYKPIPRVTTKAPCIKLWLSDAGTIDGATEVNEDVAATLRKFGDNQSSFPAFNIVPLYRITDAQQIDELEQLLADNTLFNIETVKSFCTSDNWISKKKKNVHRCLAQKSETLLKAIKRQDETTQNSVTELISVVRTGLESVESFRAALETCVFCKLQKQENINIYLKLLFHIGNIKKSHEDDCGNNLSIILDVSNWERYGFPVAHEHTTEWINDILLKSDDEIIDTSENYDAFGSAYSDVGEPMPGVKLKGFEVILRAMFNAQRCQYRYGKIDDESYPITKVNRAAAQGSLEWIGSAENQGVTWQSVDQNEIIFVYPSVFPKIPQKLVTLFNARQNDIGKTEARFLDIAQELAKSLRGLSPRETPKNIQVFSVRKMDKARTKVVLNRNYSPEWFIHAAMQWQRGCQNLPDLDIRAFPPNSPSGTSGNKLLPERLSQLTPFPLQFPRIVNNVWKQNGELAQGKSAVKRMQYYQGVELLLDSVEETAVRYYLNTLLSNSIGLVQHIGNQQNRRLASSNKQGRDIAFLFSAIGLLLYKCGCEKGDYMENTAYLVGQILKISDELHAFYCKIVRKGEAPAQLAGNSVFVTATETPAQALAQLCVRMNPYIAWAKQYRVKKIQESGGESWRANWYLGLYEDAATKLKPLLTDVTRFDDFDKAQVFIGYLAAFPKREKDDEDDEDNKNTMHGEDSDE